MRRARGFTLIEVLQTLACLVIIVAACFQFYEEVRVGVAANEARRALSREARLAGVALGRVLHGAREVTTEEPGTWLVSAPDGSSVHLKIDARGLFIEGATPILVHGVRKMEIREEGEGRAISLELSPDSPMLRRRATIVRKIWVGRRA